MKTFGRFCFLFACIILSGVVHADILATNELHFRLLPVGESVTNATEIPIKNGKPTNKIPIIPLIDFRDVPITMAIANLARQAGVNYLMDTELMEDWLNSTQPTVTIRWKEMTAKQALIKLLDSHNLALKENRSANIAAIFRANHIRNWGATEKSELAKKSSSSLTNTLLPQIIFTDVPITTAIDNLARIENINYIVDKRISDLWNGLAPDYAFEPILSLRFENVTARDTLNCLLNIRGLALVDDSSTHVSYIVRSDQILSEVDAKLLGVGEASSNPFTNEVATKIKFTNVPLDVILEQLIRLGTLPIKIDPQIKAAVAVGNDLPSDLSLRWEGITPNQAIVALCQNYNLALVKDALTNEIWIKPQQAKRHHHLRLR